MKKLMRSQNKIVGGVCAGIAEYFEIDPTLVRAGYAVCGVFTGLFPSIVLYIVLLIVMPQEQE